MAEKYDMTLTLDFTSFFKKQGKSPQFEFAISNVTKGIEYYMKKLQQKKRIDLYTATREGDVFHIWIIADKRVLEGIKSQFGSRAKTEDKEDRQFLKIITNLRNMFKGLLKFSEIKPIKEDEE